MAYEEIKKNWFGGEFGDGICRQQQQEWIIFEICVI
jgi:hypothetical protein